MQYNELGRPQLPRSQGSRGSSTFSTASSFIQQKIKKIRMEVNCNDSIADDIASNIHSRVLKSSKTSSLQPFKKSIERFHTEHSQVDTRLEESLFSPKILERSKSLLRKLNVSTLLYQDALRRQSRQHSMLQSERKQLDLMSSPKSNPNTNSLVLNKIKGQFNQLVNDNEVNPLIALSVLEELFNVNLNPHKQSLNYIPVQKLIDLLAGQGQEDSIRVQNLWHFITLVVTGQCQKGVFGSEEQKQIIQNYQYFYKERMARERKLVTPQKLTFRPKTLDSSNKLAHSFREKTCRKIDTFLQSQKINLNVDSENYTLEDLYVIEHHQKLADNQRKRIHREQMELQHCTFKPDLSPSNATLAATKNKPKIPLRSNKAHHLRTQNTHTSYQENQPSSLASSKIVPIRSREQRERARKQREGKQGIVTTSMKDVEKTILRMSVGRQKRQYSSKVLERGYPKDENWKNYQNSMHQTSVDNCKRLKGYKK